MLERTEKEISPQLEVQQTNARLELKERQLRDLADAFRKFSPADALTRKYEDEANEAAADAKRYRDTTVQRMNEELEKMKSEQKQREDERRAKMLSKLQYVCFYYTLLLLLYIVIFFFN